MFSDDSGMKIEHNNKITEKPQIIWKLNDTLLNNTQVKEEVPGEVTNYFELNKRHYIIFPINISEYVFLKNKTSFNEYNHTISKTIAS